MGIFDALKNGYDKDDDLKDIEELMYDNESGSKSRRSINDMIKSLELGEKESHKKKDDGYAIYLEIYQEKIQSQMVRKVI